jgi:hypothetical protein
MADSYRHGRIIYAYLRSSASGKMQRHPAVILDIDEDIRQPETIDARKSFEENVVHVVGVSTKYKSYKLESIALPYSGTGHASSRLKEDCGAIIGWYHRVSIPDDVIGFGGDVPPAVMAQILDAARRDLIKKIGGELGTLKQVFDKLFG